MGMPAEVEIVGGTKEVLDALFHYFAEVDARFSTYKPESEIMRINRGELLLADASEEVREIFALAKATARDTQGYFSITTPDGTLDPSGLVKGWAIYNAAQRAEKLGYHNYFIDIGGDIQSKGSDAEGNPWSVGIRNPFSRDEIVKVIYPRGRGVATSGTAARGEHIYNPHAPKESLKNIVSLTVVGPNIYEADRYATAAFAMGARGIFFIEQLPEHEGYSIDVNGTATMTTDFARLTTI